ncbi:myo-inositol transporter, partial [Rhizopus stolonifer]
MDKIATRKQSYDSISFPEAPIRDPIPSLTPFVYSLVLSVCLGGFLFGYDTGVISGALIPLEKEFIMTTRQKEFVVGGTTFGAIFGGLFAGTMSDKFGASSIFIIGSTLLAFAPSYNVLLSGRFVVGLGVGMASMIIPVYISEISPKNFRGRLSALNNIIITFGQVVAYVINLTFAQTEGGWRYMFGIGALPAIAQLLIMPFMPESPRQLVVNHQIGAAKHTFQKIYGSSISNEFLDREIKAIQQDMENTSLGRYRDFLKPRNFRPLLIACLLQCAQQLCGFNTVMYYAATILRMANFKDPTTSALTVAITNLLFTIVAIFFIDKVGRRSILVTTMFCMIVCLFALAGSFYMQKEWLSVKDASDNYSGIPGAFIQACFDKTATIPALLIISMTLYVAAYASGLGCIPWIVQGELFNLRLRGKANGIATTTNWVCNLLAASTFLSMVNALTLTGTFWFYGFLSIFLWYFIVKLMPE